MGCMGAVSVKESNSKAKVREVIWTNARFQYIEPAIVKDMTSFFQQAQSPSIFHSDCDGIMLFDGNNGEKYIFLSELKSTFDSSDIYHAKDQIISSYLKINMVMHLLYAYNREDYIVKGFIFSYPPQKSYLQELYKQQMMNPSTGRYKTEAEFVLDLCYGSNKISFLRPTDCHCLKNLPLGDRGIFDKIEFHFVEVPVGQQSITLDVQQFI